ncbi:MAG TPA: TonB-dependent receptor [Allosphingosinicella sp.]|nr:TonB-dependent receptor [Allosphingosinicella sp.]
MSTACYRHGAAWTAAAAIFCAAPAAAQPALDYALPAQPLSQSLRDVASRSGTNVIAPSDLVGGRQAQALRGRFGPREAVQRLLSGTGLRVSEIDGSLIVMRGADSMAAGEEGEGRGAEAIVVTGSNLRGAEPTSPLVRIGREEIDRTGATSAEQLMRRVPQNSQGGVNQENNGIITPDTDVTNHGAGLNLRGLGQRATLVLVNGRRLAPSGGGAYVDISLIPLSAVERVDILPDGASAIYGSDAVGGVVNFVLRGGDGVRPETSLLVGTATQGGGTQVQAAQSIGGSWASGNALLAYEFRREDEVRADQRAGAVGLQPGTFLLPRETRHNLLGTLEQELADGVRAGVTGSYAHRATARTAFVAATVLPTDVDADAEAVSLSGQVAVDLPSGWLARLDGNYSLAHTDQVQIQQTTNRLMNSRQTRNRILEGSLRVDGAMFDLPAGPVRLAVGGNLRHEAYRDASESASIARTVKAASREAWSLFGEVQVPFFSRLNARPGLERLLVSAAARYDHYEGTGSTFDPKIGLLWSPVSDLDLRASYGTSYRAPLLSETSGLYNAFYFPAALLYAVPGSAPPGTVGLVLQGSDPNIRPETSRTWSVGAELSPRTAPGLTLSFNYYAIRFSDRISVPISALNVVGNPAFASVFTLSPSIAQVNALLAGAGLVLDAVGGSTPAAVGVILDTRSTNTAVTRTRGFDLGLRYRFDLNGGRVGLEGQVTHIIAFEDQLTATAPVVKAVDRPFRPVAWRGRGGATWSRGGWAGSLFVNVADDYVDDRRPLRARVGTYTTVDANLSYTFGEAGPAWLRGTRISLFADNLLDEAPPPLAPAAGAATGIGYDPVNATIRGRFVAVQVRRTW